MSLRNFRYVAFLEATSFLALLVASYVKHTDGGETGVQILGPIHGLLFITYVVFALRLRAEHEWSGRTTALVLLGAVLPFGGYAVDWWLIRDAERAGRNSRPLLALLALLAAASLGPLAAAGRAAPQDHWTPLAVEVLAPPQPVLAGDGKRHLAYELVLTNRGFPAPTKATVRRVEALAGGKVLRSISGRHLAEMMSAYGRGKPPALNAGETGSLLMDIAFPRRAKIPGRIVHRVVTALSPRNELVREAFTAAPTRVVREPATVVAPPLRGSGWVVGNGCCDDPTSHRSSVLAVNGGLHAGERFAIDFFQLTDGRTVDGPVDRLTSYPYFGAEVISATAGRVVTVVDGLPETPVNFSLPPIAAAKAGGNHVVVRLRKGVFAFYGHLQPGSIMVRPGQRVRPGQVIARLGSSGNSNAPHLHFQLMDRPLPLAAEGLPFRFSRYRAEGTLRNFAPVLVLGAKAKIAPAPRGAHSRRLPLNNQVIGFE